jgi:hypothetical protein
MMDKAMRGMVTALLKANNEGGKLEKADVQAFMSRVGTLLIAANRVSPVCL